LPVNNKKAEFKSLFSSFKVLLASYVYS
jgi:hypothetical protein